MLYDPTVTEAFINSPNPGCDCVDACSDPLVCACLIRSRGRNYDPDANILLQLQSPQSSFDRPVYHRPIYECNSWCFCQKDRCRNRMVQNRQHDTTALYASDAGAKGRGVFAARRLRQGEFVCVFAGHYMKPRIGEAHELAIEQLENWNHVYVMVVEEYGLIGDDHPYVTIVNGAHKVTDIRTELPLTSLINHSCDPNMTIFPVRVDTTPPLLACFANRAIDAGKELTISYYAKFYRPIRKPDKECHCRSRKCQHRLPLFV
uniref:SET domain-containing protein n=1 Tax=Mesocestoides corti TaxID=53468 RepID=A0A5K3FBV9_MESCO